MRHTLSSRAAVRELRELSADYEHVFADAATSIVEQGAALARETGLDASGHAIESGAGAWRALTGCTLVGRQPRGSDVLDAIFDHAGLRGSERAVDGALGGDHA